MPLIVDDYGTRLIVVVEEDGEPLDISTATAKTLELTKPDGTVESKTAVFFTDGTDGKLLYTTIAGDMDVEGLWYVRGCFTLGGWVGRTRRIALRVEA